MKARGFTLIELLIYIATFVVVATTFVLFVINMIQSQAKTRIDKEVMENAHRAMEVMTYEIRHALSVYQPTSDFVSDPGQLSLVTQRHLPADEAETYIDFFVDNDGRLGFKKEGIVGEPVTTEKVIVSSLDFDYLTTTKTNSVRIQLTLVYNGPSDNAYYQATSTLVTTTNLYND